MGSLPNELALHTCPVCGDASKSYRDAAEGRSGGFVEGARAPALTLRARPSSATSWESQVPRL